MFFDILPVLISSVLSAVILNYFFIPPIYTFHIYNADDLLLFLMYLVIALVNAVLTIKIREQKKKVRDREEKENTIKLYNTLFNSLSHELKTPISTIIGIIDILKEKKVSQENHEQLINEIDIACIRLNRQIENLLCMSRLESGIFKPHYDWCDLNELITSVINKLEDVSGNHIITFNNDETIPLIKIDSILIEQALQNIIYNAILYTPENSVIKIESVFENNHCKIIIEDNGNGIPEDKLNLIFDKFYRLPMTKSGGTGLGLSIAKGFINAHKGSIYAKNINPKGLRFAIFLPVETSFLNQLKNE